MKVINYRSRTLALKIMHELQNCLEARYTEAVDSRGINEVILTLIFKDCETIVYILEQTFFNEFLKPFVSESPTTINQQLLTNDQ